MIKVTLKDGVVKEYESGTTVAEVAKSLGAGLYKSMCACKINGNVCDVRTPLTEDCELAILTFDNVDGKKAFWHTTSHILAQAVKRLYPEAKFAIGPAIDTGFYYDFDVEKPFSPEDLEKITAEMKKSLRKDLSLKSLSFLLMRLLNFLRKKMSHIRLSFARNTQIRESQSAFISRANL